MNATILFFIGVTVALGQSPLTDTQAIRAGSAVMNRAYATKDTALLGSLLTTDFQLTTGAGSRTVRTENKIGMALPLQKRSDLVMIFTPDRVDASETIGAEAGTWVERWKEPDGAVELRGSYLVMWGKQSGQWRQKSLLLVPTSCTGGAYCQP